MSAIHYLDQAKELLTSLTDGTHPDWKNDPDNVLVLAMAYTLVAIAEAQVMISPSRHEIIWPPYKSTNESS